MFRFFFLFFRATVRRHAGMPSVHLCWLRGERRRGEREGNWSVATEAEKEEEREGATGGREDGRQS